MSRFLWTQKQDTGPSGRFGHAMAYDQDRALVVLFGGRSSESQVLNDTWEWDGEFWTQMADIGPSARSGHALVYDGARRRSVLFGGSTNQGSRVRDTWEWNGEDWTQIADEGPVARSEHAMAFDTERKKIVLFGGQSANDELHGDTWEWDGEAWTQQQDTGPSPRRGHAMAYDNKRRRTVLFGGQSQTPVGDTWEWNGSIWTQMADFGPDPCLASALAYDGENVLIYGGISSIAPEPAPEVFGNTWDWNGKHWTQRQDIGPGPRWLHAVTFDTKNGCLVLFGGLTSFAPEQRATDARSDTWESSDSGSKATDSVTLASFTISPNQPPPQTPVTAVVSLSGPAPVSGTVVTLACDLLIVGLPSSIMIPPNASNGQITFLAPFIQFGQVIQVKATLGGVTKIAAIGGPF